MSDEKVMRFLKCHLTAAEVVDRSQQLASAELARDEAQRVFDAEAEAWKERKKELDARVLTIGVSCTRLARAVKDREEEREVECRVQIDGSTYTLVRTDTGEVVQLRPATVAEMQRPLNLEQ